MCQVDMTLEGQDPLQSKFPDSSGYGVLHVCKNYWEAYEWAEDNRYYEFKSLDYDIPEEKS